MPLTASSSRTCTRVGRLHRSRSRRSSVGRSRRPRARGYDRPAPSLHRSVPRAEHPRPGLHAGRLGHAERQMGVRVRRSGCGAARAVVRRRASVLEDHRRSLHLPVEAERHRRHGLPRRRLVPAHVHGSERLAGAAGAAQFRRRRLRGADLGERRSRRTASRRPRELRARRHRSAQARRQHRRGPRLRSGDRHDHPPRQAGTWKPKSESIFYTRTTGLWQPVWIEAAGPTRIGKSAGHAGRRQVADHRRGGSRARRAADAGHGRGARAQDACRGDARRSGAGRPGGERARHAGHRGDHARRAARVASGSARALRPHARDPVGKHRAWTASRATSGSGR